MVFAREDLNLPYGSENPMGPLRGMVDETLQGVVGDTAEVRAKASSCIAAYEDFVRGGCGNTPDRITCFTDCQQAQETISAYQKKIDETGMKIPDRRRDLQFTQQRVRQLGTEIAKLIELCKSAKLQCIGAAQRLRQEAASLTTGSIPETSKRGANTR